MKAYRLFLKPDRAVPQFTRLRFEEVDVPLRDVLTRGCHPVDACHYRGSPKRDTSHAAEAVVNRLNEDDARVAALVTPGRDFGYSHDLHLSACVRQHAQAGTASPPSRYAYGEPEPQRSQRSQRTADYAGTAQRHGIQTQYQDVLCVLCGNVVAFQVRA